MLHIDGSACGEIDKYTSFFEGKTDENLYGKLLKKNTRAFMNLLGICDNFFVI